MHRFLVVGAVAAALTFPTVTTAHAASYTSTGERCTIVGTSGADVLTGTSRSDVICGKGGNDVIRAGGGSDVIDGGTGKDRIAGDSGDDRIYGGSDNDTLYGGPGADRVDGGDDTDKVSGDTGVDTVKGGAGSDVLSGGDGTDRLYGGPDGDVLLGGDDADQLSGDTGNDDLDGQAGGDNLNGGAGTNWCVVGSSDTQKACVYDKTKAEALEIEVRPGVVDVSEAAQEVLFRVRVVDDTGVTGVLVTPDAGVTVSSTSHRVSGTPRDGWWEVVGHASRFTPGATADVEVWMEDRVGRQSGKRFPDAVTVIDRNADTAHPVVSDVTIAPSAVDVRSASATVTVTTRIVDPLAGVTGDDPTRSAPPDVNLWVPGPDGSWSPLAHGTFTRISGDRFDGVHSAKVVVPKGAPGGVYSAEIRVRDEAGNAQSYYGATRWNDAVAHWPPGYVNPDYSGLAGGDLTVTGTAFDTTAPQVTAVRIDKPTVDTLASDQQVMIEVDASDLGDGVLALQLWWSDNDVNLAVSLGRVSGTTRDGRWRTYIDLPQGTPPGNYTLRSISVGDRWNRTWYNLPATAGTAGNVDLPATSVRTTGGALWDGVLTIADNPAAG